MADAYANPTQASSSDIPTWEEVLKQFVSLGLPGFKPFLGSLADFQKDYLDENASDAYRAFGTFANYGKSGAYQNWLNKQYDKYRGQYETLATKDPSLYWTTFLANQNPEAEYAMESPEARGTKNNYQPAPTMRMVW